MLGRDVHCICFLEHRRQSWQMVCERTVQRTVLLFALCRRRFCSSMAEQAVSFSVGTGAFSCWYVDIVQRSLYIGLPPRLFFVHPGRFLLRLLGVGTAVLLLYFCATSSSLPGFYQEAGSPGIRECIAGFRMTTALGARATAIGTHV